MLTSVLSLAVLLLSLTSAAVLRPADDGFSLEQIDGVRHFGYSVVPVHPGQVITMQFYNVDFASDDCDDIRVDVYDNGYVKTPGDLVKTLCDQTSLAKYETESDRGFYIALSTSNSTKHGQLKVRFAPPGAFKVTRQILYK